MEWMRTELLCWGDDFGALTRQLLLLLPSPVWTELLGLLALAGSAALNLLHNPWSSSSKINPYFRLPGNCFVPLGVTARVLDPIPPEYGRKACYIPECISSSSKALYEGLGIQDLAHGISPVLLRCPGTSSYYQNSSQVLSPPGLDPRSQSVFQEPIATSCFLNF